MILSDKIESRPSPPTPHKTSKPPLHSSRLVCIENGSSFLGKWGVPRRWVWLIWVFRCYGGGLTARVIIEALATRGLLHDLKTGYE
jgi:hypothetical protein